MKNIIEINGRQYDAITGKLLNGNFINKPSDTQRNTHSPIRSSGVNIDGVNRTKEHHSVHPVKQKTPKPAPQTKEANLAPAPKQAAVKVVDGLRKKPQKAITLSRKFVKKPSKAAAPVIMAKSNPADGLQASYEKQDAYTRFSVFKKVPDAKLAKAISHKTSSAISKFSKATVATKPVVNSNLQVAKAPSEQMLQPKVASPGTVQTNSEPKKSVFEHHAIQPINKQQAANTGQANERHTIKPFHKKTHYKVRNRRYLAGLAAAAFAVFLFIGFLAYQKVPQVAVKVAARNAGFNARVPGNIPSGYAYKSPVNASKDSLTIAYKSNTDKRSFQITQKPSNWTSESLLSNYLIEGKKQYQAYYNKGMTVFIYDNNNATWVDKGVWFTLNANGSLSSDQILSIASSI